MSIHASRRSVWGRLGNISVVVLAITQIAASPWARHDLSRSQTISAPNVPLVRIIANPEKYDGKRVAVGGYVRLQFENSALYINEDMFSYSLFSNSIWIDAHKEMSDSERNDLNGKYVTVTGTFDASMTGHMGVFSGGMRNIERVTPIVTQSDFKNYLYIRYLSYWIPRIIPVIAILLIICLFIRRRAKPKPSAQ